jgi:hypothetical protein
MEHYVGLDVSLKLTAICIVDRTGKIVREGVVPSDLDPARMFMESLTIGPELENSQGQLSPWAIRATKRDATAMPRNLPDFGSARRRGVCANSLLMHCSKEHPHSITSSARC